jgi:hypothetical protein
MRCLIGGIPVVEQPMVSSKKRGVLIRCPRGRKPQFAVNEDGIEVKCHSCKNEFFRVSWAVLDQIRADLAAGREPLGGQSCIQL